MGRHAFIKRVGILCWMMVCCFCDLSRGQIFIEDGKVRRSVNPGENITGKLTLHNTSDQPVSAKVYWEDFVYVEPFDGTKDFLPKGTSETSAANWVSFSPHEINFEPFSKKTVTYSFNVPADIDQGFYGVLFFERENIGKAEGEKGLTIISRVGCLFFIEPSTRSKEIELTDIAINEGHVTAVLANKGNVVLIPEGIFYVMDQEGVIADRGKVEKLYIPAGAQTPYNFDLKMDHPDGSFTLVLTFDVEDGDVVVKEIDFDKSNLSEYKINAIRD